MSEAICASCGNPDDVTLYDGRPLCPECAPLCQSCGSPLEVKPWSDGATALLLCAACRNDAALDEDAYGAGPADPLG